MSERVTFWQRLLWRLKALRRPYCRWREKHNGFWAHGYWVCTICGEIEYGPPPAGTVMTDEGGERRYMVRPDGAIKRMDKPQGTKKERARARRQLKAKGGAKA